jgi:hypothetical protein
MTARGDVRLGGGPAMSIFSFHGRGTLNGTIPHPALVALFEAAAKRRAYRCSGARISARSPTIPTCSSPAKAAAIDVGFPARYTHSSLEVCDLDDLEGWRGCWWRHLRASTASSVSTATTSSMTPLSRHRHRNVRIEGRAGRRRWGNRRERGKAARNARAAAGLGRAPTARGLVG